MPGRITAIAMAPPSGQAAERVDAADGRTDGWDAQAAVADGLWRVATVDFGGVCQPVSLACLPEAQVGDRVLVHVGVALSIVHEEES